MKVGHFKDDVLHGDCITITVDGDYERSSFEYGSAHGDQILEFADGRTFTNHYQRGEFKQTTHKNGQRFEDEEMLLEEEDKFKMRK